ncbi:MAG: metallophosphoesterase [Bacteroidota bacterium]|nr:metallophosphoesterase [Bacteroidota bacterium]
MKVQYCSDLHLEFRENNEFLKRNPIQPNADILLLAGDIVPFAVMNKHEDFFSYLSDNFKYSFWIPGNHEYYNFDIKDKSGAFTENIKSNVFLINNTSTIVENVKFIFSTLWTKISPAYQWQIERGLNDFHVIKNNGYRFSADKYNQLHNESLKFIEKELEEKSNKTVVLTHHVPTFIHYPEKYKGDILSEAFAIELFDLIETNGPDYWVFGHHHSNAPDFEIGKTQMRTNQMGYIYYGEHRMFKRDKTFTL